MSRFQNKLSIWEFCKVCSGGTPDTSNQNYWEGGLIPWMSSGEVHKKRVKDTERYITNEGLLNSSAKIFPRNTVLVALAGQGKTRGTVAINEIELSTNQSIAGIISDQSICLPEFLYYNLGNRYQELRSESGGSGRAGLNLSIISNLKINLPPLPEQKKIASILNSVDVVIEYTQKQIDKLQYLKKATLNKLLTKGIGHKEFKENILGRIPKNWDVKRLSEICEVSSSKRVMQSDYVNEGIPFYRSKEIILKSKGEEVESTLYISKDQFFNLSAKYGAPSCGDILITAVGTIGICYLIDQEKFYFKDGNLLWLKNIKILFPLFLLVFLSNQKTRERIIDISSGSSQSALTIEKLSEFLVLIPSDDEQKIIIRIANAFNDSIDSQRRKLTKTKSLKKSLMQDLFSGRKRVNI